MLSSGNPGFELTVSIILFFLCYIRPLIILSAVILRIWTYSGSEKVSLFVELGFAGFVISVLWFSFAGLLRVLGVVSLAML